jgi:hypothetical protein
MAPATLRSFRESKPSSTVSSPSTNDSNHSWNAWEVGSLAKRWNAAQRRDALERGHALPPLTEGDEPRYPIDSCSDVENAIRDLNRPGTPDTERVRRYIARRAVELGCALPPTWKLRKGSE